jgi:hypothetical protein
MIRSAHDSSQVSAFLNPVNGYRGQLARKGIAPKDHAAENKRALRELEASARAKTAAAEAAAASESYAKKPAQFNHVESIVVKTILSKETNPSDTASHEFLKKGARQPPATPQSERQYTRREKTKPALPDFSSHNQNIALEEPKPKNFIAENAKTVVVAPEPSKPINAKKESHKAGEVPQYLVERKAAMEREREEAERVAREQEQAKSGMVLLGDAERLSTLDQLLTSKEDAVAELHRLPFSDTLRVKKRRTELEKRIEELEAAVAVFSREKVYVKE